MTTFRAKVLVCACLLSSCTSEQGRGNLEISEIQANITSVQISWSFSRAEETTLKYFNITALYKGPCNATEAQTVMAKIFDVTQRQFVIEGLEEFSKYNVSISGYGSNTSFIYDSVTINTQAAGPSEPPRNVREKGVTDTTITIAWDPIPCLKQNTDILNYRIHVGQTRSSFFTTAISDDELMYTQVGLKARTSYFFQVFPVLANFAEGPASQLVHISTNGESTQLQTVINGTDGNVACLYGSATYICTVPATEHLWSSSKFYKPFRVSINASRYSLDLGSYAGLVSVTRDGTAIISEVKLYFFVYEFNGTVLTCEDGTNTTSYQQRAVVTLAIYPVKTVRSTSDSLMWTDVISMGPKMCYMRYLILGQGNTRVVYSNTSEISSTKLHSVGFQYCIRQLISIIPVLTGGMNAPAGIFTSQEVVIFDPDIGDPVFLDVSNDGFNLTVSWQAPTALLRAVNVSVWHGSPNSGNCVVYVEGKIVQNTVEMMLDCTYAKHKTAVCVQFISDDCRSNRTKILTPEMPGLILAGPIMDLIQTTHDSIGITVKLNEGTNCINKDKLYIRASLRNERRVILSYDKSFSSGQSFVFRLLQPGVYTCTISVMIGTDLLEYREIRCQTITVSTVTNTIDTNTYTKTMAADATVPTTITAITTLTANTVPTAITTLTANTVPTAITALTANTANTVPTAITAPTANTVTANNVPTAITAPTPPTGVTKPTAAAAAADTDGGNTAADTNITEKSPLTDKNSISATSIGAITVGGILLISITILLLIRCTPKKRSERYIKEPEHNTEHNH